MASAFDPAASALATAWSAEGAALLSADDLCRPGWSFRVSDPDGGRAVVAGSMIDVGDIRAVVTRRPAVISDELVTIDEADRGYLATEINAFLVAWLSTLTCPVVNRPTTTCLCGPPWSDVHWQLAASRAGIAWHPAAIDDARATDVLVCGMTTIGTQRRDESDAAIRLAAEAGVSMLAGAVHRRQGLRGDSSTGTRRPTMARARSRPPPPLGTRDTMILLWGVAGDAPFDDVRQALSHLGADVHVHDQRLDAICKVQLSCTPDGGRLRGTLTYDHSTQSSISLDDVGAVYVRPYSTQEVCRASAAAPGSPSYERAMRSDLALLTWADLSDALVVNRPAAMAANGSKPFQLAMIATHGFAVPDTLITTDAR